MPFNDFRVMAFALAAIAAALWVAVLAGFGFWTWAADRLPRLWDRVRWWRWSRWLRARWPW